MSADPLAKTVTMVVPVCNEELGLARFLALVDGFAADLQSEMGLALACVFIDDGSSDSSPQILVNADLPNVWQTTVVLLTRNAGAHAAIAAGLEHADGAAVVVMAADGQDPFSAVREMIERWQEGAEVVWGERSSRADPWTVRISSFVFGLLMTPRDGTGHRVPTGSFVLVDGALLPPLNALSGLPIPTYEKVAWLQAQSARVPYERPVRTAGQSKWNHRGRLSAGFSALLRSRTALTRLSRWLATLVFISALAFILGSVAYSVTIGALPGWTTLVVIGMTSLAIQSVFFVIIVEYVSRTYAAAFRAPLFFVRDVQRRRR